MSGYGQNGVDKSREGCTQEMTLETGFESQAGVGIGMSEEDKGCGQGLRRHDLTSVLLVHRFFIFVTIKLRLRV